MIGRQPIRLQGRLQKGLDMAYGPSSVRRIVLREDHLGRATGFYVEWTCRYRDEVSYQLRPIGSDSSREITLLDSGEFRYNPTSDEREAVKRYELVEREEFVKWCATQPHKPDPALWPEHALFRRSSDSQLATHA